MLFNKTEIRAGAAARLSLLWLSFIALALCSSVSSGAETAEQRFLDLEGLLSRAGRFDFKAHVVASGAVSSDVTAKIGVANAGVVVIRMQGRFGGKNVDAVLRSDGVVTMVKRQGQEVRLQPGKSMRQSVELGLMRVGLWHNLMLLSHGMQPEHNEGGVSAWAAVSNIRYADVRKKGFTGLAFDIAIEGEKVGHATLWLNDTTHMPVRREQSIVIDGKTINTIEDYSEFVPTA